MQELAIPVIKVALTAGQMMNLIPMLAKRCKVVPLSSDELVYKCASCMKKKVFLTKCIVHTHIHSHTAIYMYMYMYMYIHKVAA